MTATNNQTYVPFSIPLPRSVKYFFQNWTPTRVLWSSLRSRQLEKAYWARREHYAHLAGQSGLIYKETDITAQTAQRLSARGYTPKIKEIGNVHTYAFIPMYGWHQHLLPDLHELGSVTLFDYTKLGFSVEAIAKGDKHGLAQRHAMLKLLIPDLYKAHAKQPIDWIFFYAGGQDISPTIVRQITETIGVPVVNMSLDDKQGWSGRWNGECRAGAVDITAAFDLYMTSSRLACEWHILEGGRPIYLPEGYDSTYFRPLEIEQDYAVSFAGAAYGPRAPIVNQLREYGIDIKPFGKGWQNGWVDNLCTLFNRSHINLGMGAIEYSESITNVKGRDFEVPGSGGGIYITSFNADLARHYQVGEEIVCYGNRNEMLELIRYYLAHPDEAKAIATRAHLRSLREHRWLHRYQKLLTALGIMAAESELIAM